MASKRLLKHIAIRGITLYLTVVVAVYLTIIIANMGGKVDEFVLADLYTSIHERVNRDPQYRALSGAERDRIVRELFELEVKRLGYDRPFIERSFIYLRDALTLDLGRALFMYSDSGSRLVRNIILERLPNTILLFTTVTMVNFFLHLFLGLYLSRHHGSLLDRLVVSLSPTSTVPGWFYGIFFILIFYTWLHLLPPGGMVDVPPPPDPFSYALSVLKHMILPMLSWIVASFFLGVYGMRTFFLIFSTEDYVEAAKAKGLPPRLIETRYILRPSLPPILTSFALSLIGSWGGAIITERVFQWPGLGMVTWQAIMYFDTPVLVGITVIYAYLLAATVFILDIVYAFVDPRIKAGISG
uniref:ABC transporter permease n=1 Tax=Thermofilum pendens TaxID=2269 RepID=A0A7C3SLH6_THEPE